MIIVVYLKNNVEGIIDYIVILGYYFTHMYIFIFDGMAFVVIALLLLTRFYE
jgi:hypothetical protein